MKPIIKILGVFIFLFLINVLATLSLLRLNSLLNLDYSVVYYVVSMDIPSLLFIAAVYKWKREYIQFSFDLPFFQIIKYSFLGACFWGALSLPYNYYYKGKGLSFLSDFEENQLILAVISTLLGAVATEVFRRGIFIEYLLKFGYSERHAVLSTSLLCGFFALSWSYPLGDFVVGFIFSGILSLVYCRERNIVFPIIVSVSYSLTHYAAAFLLINQ